MGNFPAFGSIRRPISATSTSSLQRDRLAAASQSGLSKLAKSPEKRPASEAVPIMFEAPTVPMKKDQYPMNQRNQLGVKDGRKKIVPPAHVPKASGGPDDQDPVKAQGKGRDSVLSNENMEPSSQLQVNRNPKKNKKTVDKKNGVPKESVSAKASMESRAHDHIGKKQEGNLQGKGGEGKNTLWAAKTDDFNEYIDRAGTKIRATSSVDHDHKNHLAKDSFNDNITRFINQAKNRFHTVPSSDEHTVIRR